MKPGSSQALTVALCLCAVWLGAGCATYSDQLQLALVAANRADYATAISELDRVAGNPTANDLASDRKGDLSLTLLERGILRQAGGAWRESSNDLSAADEHLEWLDLTVDPVGTLGEYLYSGSSKTYRPQPSEKLALNAFNLLNFLARGDLNGAAVEARRFTVMRETLDSADIKALSALGAFLAGYVFERQGQGDRALRYYEEALAAGATDRALQSTVERLAPVFPYRGPNLRAMLGSRDRRSSGRIDPPTEILVVIATGRVPYRVPARVDVGTAIGWAGAMWSGDADWLARSVAKVVVYPALREGRPGNTVRGLRIDGEALEASRVEDLSGQVRREYEAMKPQLIAAGLTRLAARAAVAEGVRAAAKNADGWIGALAGIAAEGTLVALDRPDTRSWTMLPSVVAAARKQVEPGSHAVEVRIDGAPARRVTVDVPAGGFAAVVVTAPH